MKRLYPCIFASLAIVAILSCGGKNASGYSSIDSLGVSDASLMSDDEHSSVVSEFVTKKYSFAKASRFADVKLIVNIPVGVSDVERRVAKSLWKHFDRVISSSYGDGERIIAKYSGDLSDGDKVLGYYGMKDFSIIEEESREEYKSMKEYRETEEYKQSADPDYEIPLESKVYATEVKLEKTAELPNHVVFMISHYGYAGGAHGGTSVSYYMYDRKTGEPVKQVIPANAAKSLQKEIRAALCKYISCSDRELNDNLMFDGSIIPLPQDPPHLSKNGVEFIYQQYEIGAYALGMPSFVIPYEKLEDILLVEP